MCMYVCIYTCVVFVNFVICQLVEDIWGAAVGAMPSVSSVSSVSAVSAASSRSDQVKRIVYDAKCAHCSAI